MEIPLYQPGLTKILRVTLTDEQWKDLATEAVDGDVTLEELVNDRLRETITG